MNSRQSGAAGPQEDEGAQRADAALHRRGSDIESLAPSAQDHDEEHPDADESGEVEQDPSAQSVDETDVLSIGGPDSLEDVEGGDDVED